MIMRFTHYKQDADFCDGYTPSWDLHCLDPETEAALIARNEYSFRNHFAFSEILPDKPPKGTPDPVANMHPIRYGNLIIDFDDGKDLGHALDDARKLALHLARLGFDLETIGFHYSGSKGFHFDIAAEALGTEDGHERLPLIYKALVEGWIKDAKLETVDTSLYAMGRGHFVRLPNRLRKNGRYKIPLTLNELFTLTPEEIEKLGTAPRYLDDPINSVSSPVLDLTEIITKVEQDQATYAKAVSRDSLNSVPLSPDQQQAIREKGLPGCVRYILEENPKPKGENTYNRLALNVIKWFQGAGVSFEEATTLADHFIEEYPHSGTYATPEARRDAWVRVWDYQDGRNEPLQCSCMKGCGFPGDAFECKTCKHRPGYDPKQLAREAWTKTIAEIEGNTKPMPEEDPTPIFGEKSQPGPAQEAERPKHEPNPAVEEKVARRVAEVKAPKEDSIDAILEKSAAAFLETERRGISLNPKDAIAFSPLESVLWSPTVTHGVEENNTYLQVVNPLYRIEDCLRAVLFRAAISNDEVKRRILGFGMGLLFKICGAQVDSLKRKLDLIEAKGTDYQIDRARKGHFRIASGKGRIQIRCPESLNKNVHLFAWYFGVSLDVIIQVCFALAFLRSNRWIRKDWKRELSALVKEFVDYVDMRDRDLSQQKVAVLQSPATSLSDESDITIEAIAEATGRRDAFAPVESPEAEG
jgi:hypothetical protein